MRRQKDRRAAILIAVLVCALVALSMLATSIHVAMRYRREGRIQQQLQQANLLLDAGCLRAVEQLRASGEYSSEKWQVGEALPEFASSQVEILVATEATAKQVTVVARLSRAADDPHSIQLSRDFTWTLDTSSSPSESE